MSRIRAKLIQDINNNVVGFNNLIDATQGLIIGFYMASDDEVPFTTSMDQTRDLAHEISEQYHLMTSTWGYEK